jgi:cellobiose phosphorylase
MQVYGKTARESGIPEGLLADTLEGEYSGESSVIAIQEKPFTLPAGSSHASAFLGTYRPDHPGATSLDDLLILPDLFEEFSNEMPSPKAEMASLKTSLNIFHTSPFLPVNELDQAELDHFFGPEKRHAELQNGQLLSFFCQEDTHVMLRAKEFLADRPHAHILQAQGGFVPGENIMATTSFAFGAFNSHISQGNTNFNVLLSICTSQFNLSPATGQRIFVEVDGKKYLLGVPSAFEMGLNHCRWIYKSGGNIFQVRTWTSKRSPQVNLDFKVLSGKKVRLLVTHDFDPLNGWSVVPGESIFESVALPGKDSMITGKFPDARYRIIVQDTHTRFKACGDEALYPDRMSRGDGFFILETEMADAFSMSFLAEVCCPGQTVLFADADRQWAADCEDAHASWKDLSLGLSLNGNQPGISAIAEILPWYGMNALTHFLTPYGLEQFSGAAWGTRDVSQGPVDLLLTMEKYSEARQVLCIIFSNQNPDGGWPQWWMFDSYQEIRAGDSHGDVFYWCLIALSNYIKVTGDLEILDEVLPYYSEKTTVNQEKTPLREHVGRLIGMIVDSFIPGTSLVPFGGGDWNDSLQPVSHDLAQRMISSWTVEMNYQAFMQYQSVYEKSGNEKKAGELKDICDRLRADFNRYLVRDGVVAGYGLVEKDGSISVLLHPSDNITGIQYSILPMERGILSGIFTPEQATRHQELIEKYLKGPDGARLMDRPLKYKGGIQEIFQRAESSTFFGREIGLMYIHEHIRYAESLAVTGKAEGFLKALRQAVPVGYSEVVPCGDIRQANCYYSSSDVAFKSRYEADELYNEIMSGRITLRGGWRVYSSGPGIFLGLIVSRLLGIRVEADKIIIDPVLTYEMDGLSASIYMKGNRVTFKYTVKTGNYSPRSIKINGKAISFLQDDNQYRQGGAVVKSLIFFASLDRLDNLVEIVL